MAQTIKEVINGLAGIVIREGDRFKLGEEVKGIPPTHPKQLDYLNSMLTGIPKDYVDEEDWGEEPICKDRLISIINEWGLVVKALVKVTDLSITASDPTNAIYKDAEEDAGLDCEDSKDYAGYRLVLWRDLDAVYGNPGKPGSVDYQKLREQGIRPPVIRYLKPEE